MKTQCIWSQPLKYKRCENALLRGDSLVSTGEATHFSDLLHPACLWLCDLCSWPRWLCHGYCWLPPALFWARLALVHFISCDPLSSSPALTHSALILPDSIVSEEERHAERLMAGWLLMVAHACRKPVGLLKLACLHISFPTCLRIKVPYTVNGINE